MLLQTILHGFRAIALLFALASRARMLPHVKNEEHVMMSIHTMKAAVLVSNGMHFRVTFCAAAHARHASPTIPVRREWSAGHWRRCQVTAKDMMGADR